MNNSNSNGNLYSKPIRIYPTEVGTQSFGRLQVHCTTPNILPIEGAIVRISSPSNPTQIIEELTTDSSGLTPEIELPAPPIDYSLDPNSEVQPYADYNIFANQPDYTSVSIANMQLLADVTAIQDATMRRSEALMLVVLYVIGPHTLFGDYPPKIADLR